MPDWLVIVLSSTGGSFTGTSIANILWRRRALRDKAWNVTHRSDVIPVIRPGETVEVDLHPTDWKGNRL